jgi:molybdenum cofactor biosynthesis enzyme MoaA
MIDADTTIAIMRSLHLAGFGGVTFTGGEPLLNPQWPRLVDRASNIGFARVGVTTHGTLLARYLEKHGQLPVGLSLLTVSLDTFDSERFEIATRGGKLSSVIEGLRLAKKHSPDVVIRANRVLVQSEMPSLVDYIEHCARVRLVDEINLLNLIYKGGMDRDYFEREFVAVQQAVEALRSVGYHFHVDSRHEFVATSANGLRIIAKDTNATLRQNWCAGCPIFCQEGLFTLRVGTDGWVTACPDYNAQLPGLDAPPELQRGTLTESITKMVRDMSTATVSATLDHFFALNSLRPTTAKCDRQ